LWPLEWWSLTQCKHLIGWNCLQNSVNMHSSAKIHCFHQVLIKSLKPSTTPNQINDYCLTFSCWLSFTPCGAPIMLWSTCFWTTWHPSPILLTRLLRSKSLLWEDSLTFYCKEISLNVIIPIQKVPFLNKKSF
jgi:hypothetical protein